MSIDLTRHRLPPRSVTVPTRPGPVILDLAATALLIIDMQNRFCAPDPARGGLDRPTRAPIVKLQRLLPAARAAQMPVIWVNWGTRTDRLNLAPGVIRPFDRAAEGLPFLEPGSPDAQIIEELTPETGDVHIAKHRISGFWDTPLDSILRNLRISTLLFAGVNLDQCVYGTLLDASCLGYDCVLLEDCAATSSPAFCTQATVYNVERSFGFVATSTDLIEGIVRDAP